MLRMGASDGWCANCDSFEFGDRRKKCRRGYPRQKITQVTN